MSNDISTERLIRVKAGELPPTSPEELDRIDAITEEDIRRGVAEDPDAAPLDRTGWPQVKMWPARIEIDLLEWLEQQPAPNRLVNELIRRYKHEREQADDQSIAHELESIAGRLRARAEHAPPARKQAG